MLIECFKSERSVFVSWRLNSRKILHLKCSICDKSTCKLKVSVYIAADMPSMGIKRLIGIGKKNLKNLSYGNLLVKYGFLFFAVWKTRCPLSDTISKIFISFYRNSFQLFLFLMSGSWLRLSNLEEVRKQEWTNSEKAWKKNLKWRYMTLCLLLWYHLIYLGINFRLLCIFLFAFKNKYNVEGNNFNVLDESRTVNF